MHWGLLLLLRQQWNGPRYALTSYNVLLTVPLILLAYIMFLTQWQFPCGAAQISFCLSASAYVTDCEIDALTDAPIILSNNLSCGLDVLQSPSWVCEDGSSLTPPGKLIHSNTISPIALPGTSQWFPCSQIPHPRPHSLGHFRCTYTNLSAISNG